MVEYEQHGRVAVLRINRPEARNAVNADVASGMEAGIDRLEDDPDTWVGVVTGEGPVLTDEEEQAKPKVTLEERRAVLASTIQ